MRFMSWKVALASRNSLCKPDTITETLCLTCFVVILLLVSLNSDDICTSFVVVVFALSKRKDGEGQDILTLSYSATRLQHWLVVAICRASYQKTCCRLYMGRKAPREEYAPYTVSPCIFHVTRVE